MALRPNRQHVPLIPKEQVIQLRTLYFKEQRSLTSLSEEFGYTRSLTRKAIQGEGKYYSGIKDNIPDSVKENRQPANQTDGVTKARLQQRFGINHSVSFMHGWTPERIEDWKRREQEGYKTSKEFGW